MSKSQKNSINTYCTNKWMNSVGFLCRTSTQHKSSGSRARKMVMNHFSRLLPSWKISSNPEKAGKEGPYHPSCQWPPPYKYPPQGTLNVRVSKAVDKWVQHGIDHCVENSNSLILVWSLLWTQTHVVEDTSPIEEADHGEVGATRGEGFLPALRWADS